MSEQKQPPAIGIDLGTTHSVVAHVDADGRPVTIRNREGELTTPSSVFFDRTTVVVGKEAVKAGQYEPQYIAQFAKRDVGKSSYNKTIRGEKLPPEVIQALVLQKLKRDAERQVGEFRHAVVTVPAFFNEPRRKSTQDAGRLAGLEVLDIINEPTAAAVAYGVQSGFLSETAEARVPEKILVYDLGGGTFDATLMEIDGRNFNAVATVGDVFLGGIDWDRRILNHVAEALLDLSGCDVRQDGVAVQALMREAEEAKHALSAREEVTIHFSHEGHRIQVPLTRDEFESLTVDLLERTRFTVNNLLRDASCRWADLTRVILVGGSTRMPMIENMLRNESGRKIDSSLSPDEAVAHGAAIYADILLRSVSSSRPRVSVRNVNSHDLGVLAHDPKTNRPRRKTLIPRNTPLPTSGAGRFVTQREGQASVKVDVIEGGDDSGHGATPIGKCVIDDLPASLPPKSPIVVVFQYEQNGRLTIDANLPHAERQATLSIERASGLSDSLLRMWEQRIAAGLHLGQGESEQEPPGGSAASTVTQQPTPVKVVSQGQAAEGTNSSWLQSDNAELEGVEFPAEDEPEAPPIQTSPPPLRPSRGDEPSSTA
jgi:molecular chaperone DnaK